MAMMRWEPFREMTSLREAMDRLLEESFIAPRFFEATRELGFPLDVVEREDSYEVRASLPGVKPEDVNITVSGDVLTVRAESKEEREEKKENYLVRERRYGTFSRSITLPARINAEQAKAKFDNGILMLTVPKSEEVKPKRIPVEARQTLGTGESGQEPRTP